MVDTPPVLAIIAEAAADEVSRAIARRKLVELLTEGDLLREYPAHERRNAIFPSDFGSCSLELWAIKHEQCDVPEDPLEEVLARLDLGSLIGAWEACLLFAGCRKTQWYCKLEYVPEGGGHIDALMIHRTIHDANGNALKVPVEFKSTYMTPTTPIKDPFENELSHVLQLSDYAHRTEAPLAVLVYIKPPAKNGERLKAFAFDPEPYRALVAQERVRLSNALTPLPPTADPQAQWQCFVCRYSGCPKNKSKMKNSAEVLFA